MNSPLQIGFAGSALLRAARDGAAAQGRPWNSEKCSNLLRPSLAARLGSNARFFDLLFQQVTNLHEQFLILGWGRWGGYFLMSRFHDPSQELDDEDIQHQGDDQKVDRSSEEFAEGDDLAAHLPNPALIAFVAWQNQTHNRHNDVVHQRLHNGAKGGPDDDADRQIYHIPF